MKRQNVSPFYLNLCSSRRLYLATCILPKQDTGTMDLMFLFFSERFIYTKLNKSLSKQPSMSPWLSLYLGSCLATLDGWAGKYLHEKNKTKKGRDEGDGYSPTHGTGCHIPWQGLRNPSDAAKVDCLKSRFFTRHLSSNYIHKTLTINAHS